jgi:hypothetical protein
MACSPAEPRSSKRSTPCTNSSCRAARRSTRWQRTPTWQCRAQTSPTRRVYTSRARGGLMACSNGRRCSACSWRSSTSALKITAYREIWGHGRAAVNRPQLAVAIPSPPLRGGAQFDHRLWPGLRRGRLPCAGAAGRPVGRRGDVRQSALLRLLVQRTPLGARMPEAEWSRHPRAFAHYAGRLEVPRSGTTCW